jgi:hypothetical protein
MDIETFSFVEFSSSKSALACVEGINNVNIVDGGFKVSYILFSYAFQLLWITFLHVFF